MSAPLATATREAEASGLVGLLSARRSEEQERRRRSLQRLDLLSSLWAPITVLALLLIPYLLVVELHPPSAAWAEPAVTSVIDPSGARRGSASDSARR